MGFPKDPFHKELMEDEDGHEKKWRPQPLTEGENSVHDDDRTGLFNPVMRDTPEAFSGPELGTRHAHSHKASQEEKDEPADADGWYQPTDSKRNPSVFDEERKASLEKTKIAS